MKNKSHKYGFLFFLSFIGVFLISPIKIETWALRNQALTRVKPNYSGERLISMSFQDQKIIKGEKLCLRQNKERLQILNCGDSFSEIKWESPTDWEIKEAFFADLNLDGVNEVVTLVWRPFRSWPVDRFLPFGGRINLFQDRSGRSCQVILLGWKGGEFKEVWAGSALAAPLYNLRAADLDGDNHLELAGLMYPYDGNWSQSDLVVWRWSGFGFSLVDREEGKFSSLELIEEDGQILMLTNE